MLLTRFLNSSFQLHMSKITLVVGPLGYDEAESPSARRPSTSTVKLPGNLSGQMESRVAKI